VITRPQNRDHRFGVDRRHQFIRIARDHCEVALVTDLSPETGDGEHGLICNGEPHLPFDRLLAVADVGRLARPFAELRRRDQTPVGGVADERAPLGEMDGAHVRLCDLAPACLACPARTSHSITSRPRRSPSFRTTYARPNGRSSFGSNRLSICFSVNHSAAKRSNMVSDSPLNLARLHMTRFRIGAGSVHSSTFRRRISSRSASAARSPTSPSVCSYAARSSSSVALASRPSV